MIYFKVFLICEGGHPADAPLAGRPYKKQLNLCVGADDPVCPLPNRNTYKLQFINKKEKRMEEIRLQKYLAEAGIASRRKCEEYIMQGRVKVNNNIVQELGTKVNPEIDKVFFDEKEVQTKHKNVYILLNKPIGYVTTVKDQFSRNTVLDLVNVKERVVPVGRLDMYTSGALLLSNDGKFVYQVTHPKHEINKTYTVTLTGIVSKEDVQNLEEGIKIENYITKPAKVRILKADEEANISRLEITIHEGKNRQVRKMCEAIGKKVQALHRSKIGTISVKSLKIGEWRYLTQKEVEYLLKNERR